MLATLPGRRLRVSPIRCWMLPRQGRRPSPWGNKAPAAPSPRTTARAVPCAAPPAPWRLSSRTVPISGGQSANRSGHVEVVPDASNRPQHVDFLRLLGDVVTAASAGCAVSALAAGARAWTKDSLTRAICRKVTAGDARQQVFPRGCRWLTGAAGKSFSREAAMADRCGRTLLFPRGRSVTSERAGNAMGRLHPVFPKAQPSRRSRPLYRRKDVPVVQVARGMPVRRTGSSMMAAGLLRVRR